MNTPHNSSTAESLDLGPLEPFLQDPAVTEIMVNGPETIYVERNGVIEETSSHFPNETALLSMIQRLAASMGQQVNESNPFVDMHLPDGSRVNVVIPPISLIGPVLTIRKFISRDAQPTIDDLLRFGSWNVDMVEFLRACVRGRLNIAISGGTGSGKTTLLNRLAGTIPPQERIIQVQHAGELDLPQKHVIPLETRPANLEGKGEITMRDLVLNALKMRPDRLLVSEVWGGEVLEVFRAINNGHDGTMLTLHANSPREALASLEVMATSANPSLPLLNVRQMMAWALDLIVQIQRLRDGSRKVVKIMEVEDLQGDVVSLGDIFEFQQTNFEGGQVNGRFTATGRIPKLLSRLQAAGIELPLSLFTPR